MSVTVRELKAILSRFPNEMIVLLDAPNNTMEPLRSVKSEDASKMHSSPALGEYGKWYKDAPGVPQSVVHLSYNGTDKEEEKDEEKPFTSRIPRKKITDLLNQNQKIQAIKVFRSATLTSLKFAKVSVEEFAVTGIMPSDKAIEADLECMMTQTARAKMSRMEYNIRGKMDLMRSLCKEYGVSSAKAIKVVAKVLADNNDKRSMERSFYDNSPFNDEKF